MFKGESVLGLAYFRVRVFEGWVVQVLKCLRSGYFRVRVLKG